MFSTRFNPLDNYNFRTLPLTPNRIFAQKDSCSPVQLEIVVYSGAKTLSRVAPLCWSHDIWQTHPCRSPGGGESTPLSSLRLRRSERQSHQTAAAATGDLEGWPPAAPPREGERPSHFDLANHPPTKKTPDRRDGSRSFSSILSCLQGARQLTKHSEIFT